MISLVKERYQALRLSIRHLNRINPNVMIFVVYGMLYDMMLNLYNPFTARYLERLGGDSLSISLLNALPGLVGIFVLLPGLFVIQRFNAKKRITAIFFFLSRLVLLFAAFIPFLPREVRPLTFIILMSGMNIPNSVSQSALQGFLGDVFDGRMRSTAISMRTKFGNVIIPLTTLTTGLIIGYIPQTDAQRIITYQIFFVLAFIVGMFEVVTFLRFSENTIESSIRPEPLRKQIAGLLHIMRDKKFLAYLLPVFIFYYTWHSGWALGNIYFIMNLHANEFWIAIFLVLAGVSSFFTAGYWNRLIQYKGNDFALVAAAIGLACNMFAYLACKNVYAMAVCHIFSGSVTTGFSIAVLNGLLGATPDKNRILYIGVFNTFINISLAVAPMVTQSFITNHGTEAALAIVGCMRLLALVPLFIYMKHRKKHEAESTSTS